MATKRLARYARGCRQGVALGLALVAIARLGRDIRGVSLHSLQPQRLRPAVSGLG